MRRKAHKIQTLLLAAGLLMAPASARANAGSLPDSLDVLLRPGDTSYMALEATFGLLVDDGTNGWRWVCHEIIVPPASSATPEYFQNADGVLFGTVGGTGVAVDPNETVFRSTDGGCNWSTVTGLTDVVIWDIAFDPNDAAHAFGGSANLNAMAFNGVWESTDSGATWTKTSLDLQQRLFLSVETSPTNSQVIWATAAWFGVDPPLSYVYRSGDGGTQFAENPFTFQINGEDQAITYILGTSPTDDLTAWMRVDGLATDKLMRTIDGGVNFTEVFTVDDNIIDVEVEADGTVWVVTSIEGIFRSTDGVNFNLVSGTPLVRGLDSDGRGLIAGVSQLADGFAIAVSTDDGANFTPQFVFKDLQGPAVCAGGSDLTEACNPLWSTLAQQLGIELDVPRAGWPGPGRVDDFFGGGGKAPGCNCALGETPRRTGAALGLLLLAGAVTAFRRRKLGTPKPH